MTSGRAVSSAAGGSDIVRGPCFEWELTRVEELAAIWTEAAG